MLFNVCFFQTLYNPWDLVGLKHKLCEWKKQWIIWSVICNTDDDLKSLQWTEMIRFHEDLLYIQSIKNIYPTI